MSVEQAQILKSILNEDKKGVRVEEFGGSVSQADSNAFADLLNVAAFPSTKSDPDGSNQGQADTEAPDVVADQEAEATATTVPNSATMNPDSAITNGNLNNSVDRLRNSQDDLVTTANENAEIVKDVTKEMIERRVEEQVYVMKTEASGNSVKKATELAKNIKF